MKLRIHFSHKEELWNAWSHACGILIGVVAGAIFLYMCFSRGDGWATAGVILYLFGMLMSYVASTAYHSLSAWSKWKERLRRGGHAAHYLHLGRHLFAPPAIGDGVPGVSGGRLFVFICLCA